MANIDGFNTAATSEQRERERKAAEQREARKKAAEEAAEAKKEREAIIDKAPTLELKQCALMSTLFSDNHLYGHLYRNEDGQAWDNRIIGFLGNAGSSKATEINNYFYADDKIKFYYDQGTKQKGFFKDLYYTFVGTDSNIKEIRLKQTSQEDSTELHDLSENLSKALNDYIAKGSPAGLGIKVENYGTFANPEDLKKALRTATANIKKSNKTITNDSPGANKTNKETHDNYYLQSVKIDYDGTNPSTARSDVKVTLSFFLESFSALQKSMLFDASQFDDGSKQDFLLRDLIIAGIGDDSRGGALNAIKNIYSPSSNRLRIKVKPETHNSVEQVPMILDLAIVDHELARDSGNHGVNLTINYRGYMQQLMQMPYANALMTKDILEKRRKRHQNIKNLISKECSQATLREILRIERSTAELEMRGSFSHIMETLFKYESIKSWKLGEGHTFSSVTKDIINSGKKKLVEINSTGGSLGSATAAIRHSSDDELKALEAVAEEGIEEASKGNMASSIDDTIRASNRESAWFEWMDGGRTWSNCVFFGDLIHAITDVLYEQNSSNPITEIKEKLKFVMFPIHIPDPNTNGSFIEINPSIIPIDLYFFAEWWHEVVVKKQLKHYPISAMMRDLTERLVNNLLYEVCVSNLLPDETPPMLRVNYFTSNRNLSFLMSKNFNAKVPIFLDYDKVSKPIFSQVYEPTEKINLKNMNDTHYIVMYVMNPPYRRELKNVKKNKELRNSKFVPTLTHGIYSKAKTSHIDSAKLNKTNSPGLREARYFNNSFGSLALMNNVYDLSFTIAENNPSTYLFPGMIINFILTDFAPNGNNRVDNSNYPNTDNDPHKKGTHAHTLGMGGYFIIKSVSYELQTSTNGNPSERFIFNCDAKFLSTEADEMLDTDERKIIDVIKTDQNNQCRVSYDEAVKQNIIAVNEYNRDLPDEEKIEQQWKNENLQSIGDLPDPNEKATGDGDGKGDGDGDAKKVKTIEDESPANALNLESFGELLGGGKIDNVKLDDFDAAKKNQTIVVQIQEAPRDDGSAPATTIYTFNTGDGDGVSAKPTPDAKPDRTHVLEEGQTLPNTEVPDGE